MRDRFGRLFALLIIAYLLSGFDFWAARAALGVSVLAGVVLAALAEGTPLPVRRVVVVGAAVLMVVYAIASASGAPDPVWGVVNLLSAGVQLTAIVLILARIAGHEMVSFQTVMGGISAYTLIGLALGSVYEAIDLFTDQEFFGQAVDRGDYAYFSMVTLTTLGFGDLTPATALAKRLVTIEALVGQVFLVTLVARLVSLWGRPMERRS